MKVKYAPYIVIIFYVLFAACSLTYLQPEDENLLNEGMTFYNEGRFGEAHAIFKTFVDEYSYSSDINKGWYYKGLTELRLAEDSITEVLISEDYFNGAVVSFKNVSTTSKYYSESVLNIGYSYYSLNMFTEARPYFDEIIKKFAYTNEVDNAYLYIGNSYRKVLEYDSAIVWYEDIIQYYPTSSSYDNALFWAGDYYFIYREDNVNRDKALKYLKEYCKISNVSVPEYYLAASKIEVMENE